LDWPFQLSDSANPERGGSILQTTILLVEDNKIQKIVNERMLHKAGYTVLNARDGEEALRLAHEAIPDIILLDIHSALWPQA
jgi:CheY-like chemotaxis protein